MRQLKLINRGLKEIHEICPAFLELTLIRSIVNSILPFVNVYMSSAILDVIVAQESAKTIIGYVVITLVINTSCSLLIAMLNAFVNTKQAEFSFLYDSHIAKKSFELDFADLENPKVFQKKQRIQDIRNLSGGGIWKLLEVFPSVVSSIVTIALSITVTFKLFFAYYKFEGNPLLEFVCSPVGSILLFFLIISSVLISIYTNTAVTKKMYAIMNGFVSFNRLFSYYLDNYISSYHAGKDIRIYNQKGLIEEESTALFGEADVTFDKLINNQIRYSGIGALASIIILVSVYLFVGLRALAGMFSVGSILLYINSINQFVSGMTNAMTNISALRVNKEALADYFEYMDIPPKLPEGHLPVICDCNGQYEISFRNVSFCYPGTQQKVIKNVSFTLKTNKRTALVGENGSGKSTIIKLLCRLYDPIEGEILLNGVDIRNIKYEEYISLFSVVFQDYKLLAFPIGQNVATSVNYDEGKIEEVLKKIRFSERLSKMEEGLKTSLYKDFDENGVEISGGEAQKIAISRALYKESHFIVLDEPTAALDPIAEAEIYNSLNEIVEDKTAVFISHRLSSCRFCDSILVFSDGSLVQQGTHDQLLSEENGIYYSLWQAQAQYYS